MEVSIEKAEKQVETLELSLANDSAKKDPTEMQKICEELDIAQKEVKNLYARWEELEQKQK